MPEYVSGSLNSFGNWSMKNLHSLYILYSEYEITGWNKVSSLKTIAREKNH